MEWVEKISRPDPHKTMAPLFFLHTMIKLLLSLPQAAAFLINHQCCYYSPSSRSLPSIVTTATSTADDPNIQSINRILLEKKQGLLDELLGDISSNSDSRDTRLANEQRVYETLLSTRLHLPFLRRSIVAPSKIKGAGRGLFATEDIKMGHVITCYPGDALLRENNSIEGNEEEYFDIEDDEYEAIDAVVLWGSHVPQSDRWNDEVVYDGSESKPPLTSYAVTVNDVHSVMGHPSLDNDPAYSGHFANDGAGHLAYEKSGSPSNIEASLELGLDTESSEFGVENDIAAYVLKSFDIANAMHQPINADEFHMITVARRDIKKGEEIMVTYGPDYWISDYADFLGEDEE